MAEGKGIEIKIAAIGGDQAAAEIRKVEVGHDGLHRALGIVTTSEGELASRRAQFLTAAEAETAEIVRETEALDRMDAAARRLKDTLPAVPFSQTASGLDEFAKTGAKVTASAMSMRMGLQNVGYQIQDIAVQAEMGTPALRIMGQQLPQLLGGFGLWGALAGSVIALGAPLAASFMKSGESAKDAKGKIDDLNQILDDHAEELKKVAKTKAAEQTAAWLDSLDAEEEYYSNINSRLERQIVLQAKLKGFKEGADSAEREAKIAGIEADPTKSEKDKITEVAAIREQDARAKAESKKAELTTAAKLAAEAAAEAQRKAERQAADVAAATAEREALETKAADLAAKSKAGAEAGLSVPKLQGKLSAAERSAAFSVNPETGETMPGYDKIQAEIARLKSEIAAAKKAAEDAPKAQAELAVTNDQLTGVRAGEQKQKGEFNAARTAAEDAYGKSVTAGALVRDGSPEIDRQYEAERQQRQQREQAALRKAEEAANAKAAAQKLKDDRKAAKDARDAMTDRLDGAEGGLDRSARSKGLSAANAGQRSGNKTLQAIGNKLADGTDAAELQKIGDQVAQAQAALGAKNAAALQAILAELNKQAAEVENLKSQIKKNRPDNR